MPIRKGEAWGSPSPLPFDGIVAGSDAEAAAALERARAAGRPFPTVGLLGGDLCRTLAGPGSEERLRSPEAMTFPIDVGEVEADGVPHLFVAHAVARSRLWRRAVVAMNAQWLGPWNVGRRAHPNDGLLDVYDARLRLGDLAKVRARLPSGSFAPHPRIAERRLPDAAVELSRPLTLWIDGRPVGRASRLVFRVLADAARVVV